MKRRDFRDATKVATGDSLWGFQTDLVAPITVLAVLLMRHEVRGTEVLKWRHLYYTHQGKNIVIMRDFKDYCALMFLKGVLMKNLRSGTGGVALEAAETAALVFAITGSRHVDLHSVPTK